ncbi:hypothetical protein FOZ60_007262 [Perkinsus olseni]|uniref:Uncharacterized protein n=1 Tax=Perkinsus olseni TaxID=32597 RepID=A0A7J6NLT1_PEROL|nr:hypothetical protein FOZ60_007262 [Perkinsus olseni]
MIAVSCDAYDVLIADMNIDFQRVGKFRQPDAVSSKGQVEATPSDLQMIMKSLAQSLRICGYLQVLRADDWSLDEIADFMSGCEVVRGFSDRVCDHLGDVSHRDIVRFASAVGDNSKCVDEFWMYIMAKKIQDGNPPDSVVSKRLSLTHSPILSVTGAIVFLWWIFLATL